MLNHATIALSHSVGDQLENPRASFSQKASGSYFVLTALFQACSIHLSRRRPRRSRTSVSVYAPQYSRSDWISFHAVRESYIAPDECIGDPIV